MKRAVLVLWLVCGLYNWGTTMADQNFRDSNGPLFEGNLPRPRDNIGLAAVMALGGPFGTVVTAVATNFNQHGWTLWSGNALKGNPYARHY